MGCRCQLHPIIETAIGLENVFSIARCVFEEAEGVVAEDHSRRAAGGSKVSSLIFGGVDLSKELRCASAWEPLLYARSRVVHAAAVAGIGCMDVPLLAVPSSARSGSSADNNNNSNTASVERELRQSTVCCWCSLLVACVAVRFSSVRPYVRARHRWLRCDCLFATVGDGDVFACLQERAMNLGFTGRAAIHPMQVSLVCVCHFC